MTAPANDTRQTHSAELKRDLAFSVLLEAAKQAAAQLQFAPSRIDRQTSKDLQDAIRQVEALRHD